MKENKIPISCLHYVMEVAKYLGEWDNYEGGNNVLEDSVKFVKENFKFPPELEEQLEAFHKHQNPQLALPFFKAEDPTKQ
jgi:hypothetical protein